MKVRSVCLAVLMSLTLVASLSAETNSGDSITTLPSWYPDRTKDFPETEFLSMLGEGVDADTARNDAMQQLANYFGMDIKSVSTGSQSYQETVSAKSTQSKLESSVSNKIQIRSTQKLFTVKTTTVYQIKPGRLVVLAYINRDTGLAAWDELERTTIDRLELCLNRVSNSALPMGTRLANYKASQVLILQISDFETKRNLLKSGVPVLMDSALATKWENLKDTFYPQSAITLDMSGDQISDIAGQLTNQLSNAGFLTGSSGVLVLHAVSSIKESPASYGLTSSQWKLDLSLTDGSLTVASLSLQGKSSGSSPEKAREKLMKDIQSQLEKNFIPELISRLLKTLD